MGGGELQGPHGVEVQVSKLPIMGGNGVNLSDAAAPPGAPVIRICLLPLMGGPTVRQDQSAAVPRCAASSSCAGPSGAKSSASQPARAGHIAAGQLGPVDEQRRDLQVDGVETLAGSIPSRCSRHPPTRRG